MEAVDAFFVRCIRAKRRADFFGVGYAAGHLRGRQRVAGEVDVLAQQQDGFVGILRNDEGLCRRASAVNRFGANAKYQHTGKTAGEPTAFRHPRRALTVRSVQQACPPWSPV
jgi:hypothetical protein